MASWSKQNAQACEGKIWICRNGRERIHKNQRALAKTWTWEKLRWCGRVVGRMENEVPKGK